MSVHPDQMVVKYYVGSDGPTILIEMRDRAGVDQLRRLIASVRDEGTSVDLGASAGVEMMYIDGLELHLDRHDRRPHLGRREDTNAFWWSCDREQWQTVYELLDPLTYDTGHQYLTDGRDDALVVVSVGERDMESSGGG